MTFSEKLKKALNEKNMRPSELAKLIGKNKSSISQYLSGLNVPKDETKRKICEVLELAIDYFNEDSHGEKHYFYNISIKEAARLLDKSEQFVRISLQQGTAPFGFATKNGNKYSYHISPKKFYEYIGTY